MKSARRILTPWRALIAVIAICGGSSPAKAALHLRVKDLNTNASHTYTATSTQATTTDFAGYTITYSATAPTGSSPTSQSLDLSAKIASSNTATGIGNFKLTLFSDSGTT